MSSMSQRGSRSQGQSRPDARSAQSQASLQTPPPPPPPPAPVAGSSADGSAAQHDTAADEELSRNVVLAAAAAAEAATLNQHHHHHHHSHQHADGQQQQQDVIAAAAAAAAAAGLDGRGGRASRRSEAGGAVMDESLDAGADADISTLSQVGGRSLGADESMLGGGGGGGGGGGVNGEDAVGPEGAAPPHYGHGQHAHQHQHVGDDSAFSQATAAAHDGAHHFDGRSELGQGQGPSGGGGGGGSGSVTGDEASFSVRDLDGSSRHLGPNRACGRCRERKLRCDGQRPLCGQCDRVRAAAAKKAEKAKKPFDASSVANLCLYADNPTRKSRKRKEPAALGSSSSSSAAANAGAQASAGAAGGSEADGAGASGSGRSGAGAGSAASKRSRKSDAVGDLSKLDSLATAASSHGIGANVHTKGGRGGRGRAAQQAAAAAVVAAAGVGGDPNGAADGNTYLNEDSSYGLAADSGNPGGAVAPPPPAPAPAPTGPASGQQRTSKYAANSSSHHHHHHRQQQHHSHQATQASLYEQGANAADPFLDMISDPHAGAAAPAGSVAPRMHAISLPPINNILLAVLPDVGTLYNDINFFLNHFPFLHILQPSRFLLRITMGPASDEFPQAALLHSMLAWTYTVAPERCADESALTIARNNGFDDGFFAFGMAPGERHAAFCKQALWASFGGWRLDTCMAGVVFGQWLYASAHLPDAWIQVGINSRAFIPISLNKTRKPTAADAAEAGAKGAVSSSSSSSTSGPAGANGNARHESYEEEGEEQRIVKLNPPVFNLTPPKDWIEEEERRRTFWISFVGERIAAATTFWANCLDERDVSVELPRATQTEFWDGNAGKVLATSEEQTLRDEAFFSAQHLDGLRLHLKAGILLGRVGALISRLPPKATEREYRRIFDSGIEQEIATFQQTMQSFVVSALSGSTQRSRQQQQIAPQSQLARDRVEGSKVDVLTQNALMIAEICSLMLSEPLAHLDPRAAERCIQVSHRAMDLLHRIHAEQVTRLPPVFSWCVGQVARSLVRRIEDGFCCRRASPHTHSSEELVATRRMHEDLHTCLDFLQNGYGARFELGLMQARAIERLISCVQAHPGGDPVGLCDAEEQNIYLLSKHIDVSIHGPAGANGSAAGASSASAPKG